MPEGDTILRAARTLARVLEGRIIQRFASPLPALAGAEIAGRRVVRVEARGKNLLFHFDDGRALHSHMRMTGSWHVYRPGERWRKPERAARAVLETEELLAVCFSAPVVEILSARQIVRHPSLSRLGADVLDPDLDLRAAREGIRRLPDAEIGEALLAQSAVAGIGNIYKSESLFDARIDPFAAVRSLSDKALDHLVNAARRMMAASVADGAGPRSTRGRVRGGGYWVYRRSGQRCFVCATNIRMRRQGDAGRSTYWCPRCQPPAGREEEAEAPILPA